MDTIVRLALLGLLWLFPSESGAQEQTPQQLLSTLQPSVVDIRAVDSISVQRPGGQTATGTYHAQGLGVIIDSQGIIATNTHIIANAGHIYVGLQDGKVLEARRVYSSDADFSFIKIDPPYPLQTIAWADSSGASIGTAIMALSNSDDEHQQIQGGEITGTFEGVTSHNVELFELNLNLSHGDSGGPLLDSTGHLLGLIMAKRNDADNKTYAIASNKIQQEYEQYQQNPTNPA